LPSLHTALPNTNSLLPLTKILHKAHLPVSAFSLKIDLKERAKQNTSTYNYTPRSILAYPQPKSSASKETPPQKTLHY
jgi:hypothetical protein